MGNLKCSSSSVKIRVFITQSYMQLFAFKCPNILFKPKEIFGDAIKITILIQ